MIYRELVWIGEGEFNLWNNKIYKLVFSINSMKLVDKLKQIGIVSTVSLLSVLGGKKAKADVSVWIDAPSYLVSGQDYNVKVGLNNTEGTRAFQWKMYADNIVSLNSFGKPTTNDFFEGHSMEPGYDYVLDLNEISTRMTNGDDVINGNGYVGEYVFKAIGNVGETGQIVSHTMKITFPDASGQVLDYVIHDFTIATPADFNLDGSVDLQDFGLLKASFGATSGATWEQGDANYDGAVDLQDFGLLKANFGTGASSLEGKVIPEPATALLMGAGFGAVVLGNKKEKKR